jgi:hypothetical protein
MDIRVILSFVASHVEQIFGTTLVLFFVTWTILLIRSIGQKGVIGDVTVNAQVDINAIEGAMKRALSSQPTVAVGAPVGQPAASVDQEELAKAIQERDRKLAELGAEIKKLQTDLQKAQQSAADHVGTPTGDGSAKEVEALKAKMGEMQARLAEYEIIEDDIADLSLFKEENAKLKSELESLKTQLASGASIAQAAPAVPVTSPVTAPAPSLVSSEDEKTLKFEKAEKFELDPNDDVMKEFAAAVQIQRAPPAEALSSVPAEGAGPAPDDAQAAIDAMFAGAMREQAEPVVQVDPQAEIDAMLVAAEAEAESASRANAPEAGDPQATIDSMLAAAEATIVKEDSIKAPVAAAPPLDSQEAIDAMFEQAQSGGLDVLAEVPDPEKMISEVAALAADPLSESSEESALEGSLDTDKLLSEVGSIGEVDPTVKKTGAAADLAGGDDLLAEFKD